MLMLYQGWNNVNVGFYVIGLREVEEIYDDWFGFLIENNSFIGGGKDAALGVDS